MAAKKNENLKKVYKACLQILLEKGKLLPSEVKKICDLYNNKIQIQTSIIVKALKKLIGDEESIKVQGYGKGTYYIIPKEFPKWKLEVALKTIPNYADEDPEPKALPPVDNFEPLPDPEEVIAKEKAEAEKKAEEERLSKDAREMISLFCERHKIKEEDLNKEVLYLFGRGEPSNREIKRGVQFLEGIKEYLQGDESIIPIEVLDSIDAKYGKCKNYFNFLFLIYTIGESPWVDFELKEEGLKITFLDVEAANTIQDKLYDAMKNESIKDLGERIIVQNILSKRNKVTEIVIPFEEPKQEVQEQRSEPEPEIQKEKTVEAKVILKRDLSKIVYAIYALLKSSELKVDALTVSNLIKVRYDIDIDKEMVFAAMQSLESEGFIQITGEKSVSLLSEDKLDEMLLKYKYQTWANITIVTMKKLDLLQKYTGNIRPEFIGKTVAGDLSIYSLQMDIENPANVKILFVLYSKQEEGFGERMILPVELENSFKRILGIGVEQQKSAVEKCLEECETL